MKDKQKKLDLSKYDLFTGEQNSSHDDIRELMAKLSEWAADSNSASVSKKKMSYSISPVSQILIKKVAEETGTTQGSVVESAPLLFGKMVLDSLTRRSESIDTLKLLHKQISSSLKSFTGIAPHLKPYTDLVGKMMDEILEMEEKAVADKNYQGVNHSHSQTFNNLTTAEAELPYNKEIETFLGESQLLMSLFKHYYKE